MGKMHMVLGIIFGAFLVTQAGAQDQFSSDTFVGAEIMNSEVQGATPSSLNYTQTGLSYGLKVGAQNVQWRTSIILNYFDKGIQNVESANLLVDYFIYKSHENVMFRPYFGVNAGYANYESINVDESGFTYGVQGGVTATVMHGIDVDLSYRYIVTGMDRFDHNTGLVFALHYFY